MTTSTSPMVTEKLGAITLSDPRSAQNAQHPADASPEQMSEHIVWLCVSLLGFCTGSTLALIAVLTLAP